MKFLIKLPTTTKLTINEVFYFIPYGIWLLWHVLSITMFSNYAPYFTTKLISLFVITVLFFKWFLKFKYPLIRLMFSIVFMSVFTISYIKSTRFNFITIMFIIISSYDIEFKKIAKFSLSIMLGVIVITILSSDIGLMDNLIFVQKNRVRESLGFTYTGLVNVLFMNCVYISFYLIGNDMKWYYWILPIGIMYWFYLKTQTRTDMILLILLFLVWLILIRNPKFSVNNIIMKAVSVLIYPFMAGLSIVLTIIYNPYNKTWLKINDIFSGRLNLGRKMYLKEGFNLFGHKIELVGNTSVLLGTRSKSEYNYIDNGYLQIAFLYGIVTLIILVFFYSYLSYYVAKIDNKYLLVRLYFVAIENFVYPNMIDPNYNLLCMTLMITYYQMLNPKLIGVLRQYGIRKKTFQTN